MSIKENTKRLKPAMQVVSAAGFGATCMGAFALSQPDPNAAYTALDGMMWVAVPTTFFAGVLWLLLDIDDWSDTDVAEKL